MGANEKYDAIHLNEIIQFVKKKKIIQNNIVFFSGGKTNLHYKYTVS
jgi:hypothetical protein